MKLYRCYARRDDLLRSGAELEPEDTRQALAFAAGKLGDSPTESDAASFVRTLGCDCVEVWKGMLSCDPGRGFSHDPGRLRRARTFRDSCPVAGFGCHEIVDLVRRVLAGFEADVKCRLRSPLKRARQRDSGGRLPQHSAGCGALGQNLPWPCAARTVQGTQHRNVGPMR